MDLGLQGAVVLVTGGAGGIGAEVCRAFAEEGSRVAVHYHSSAAAAAALAEDIGGAAFGADLRDEAAVDDLFAAVADRFGRLDVVVANAGVWPSEDVPVADMSLARWEATVAANLTTTFLTSRAFARHARATGAGSLVIIGSTAGTYGEAGHADYAASKSAMTAGLALSLKNEIVRDAPRARVNVVSPGWTVTPMTADALTPELTAKVTATMALDKVGRPEDVARAVVWLSSERAAGHVTGQVVTVAGGMEGRLLRGDVRSR